MHFGSTTSVVSPEALQKAPELSAEELENVAGDMCVDGGTKEIVNPCGLATMP